VVGYGWTRLLDRLDYAALAQSRTRVARPFDFTAFQLAALAQAGLVTVRRADGGVRLRRRASSAFTFEQCFGVLSHRTWETEVALDGPQPASHNGVLWGGNLALVAHLCGTTYLPDIGGGILVLEDVGEHPTGSSACFYQLLHTGRAGAPARRPARRVHRIRADAQRRRLRPRRRRSRTCARGCRFPIYTGLPFGTRARQADAADRRALHAAGDRTARARLAFSGYP
jgi:hypothetical protein